MLELSKDGVHCARIEGYVRWDFAIPQFIKDQSIDQDGSFTYSNFENGMVVQIYY